MSPHPIAFPQRRLPGRARSLLVAVLALSACGGKQDKMSQAAASVPVETAVASAHTVTASYAGTSTLEAVAEADVAAKMSGTLQSVKVEEGTYVHKGQLLARLDDADARAQYDQSLAQMRKADALYDYAKKAIDRKLIPQRDYSQAKYDRENQRAAFAAAKLRLAYTRVVAPISGVISRREVKAGNLVKTDQVLFHIVDMDPLQAVLNVPEHELGKLRAGQTVTLQADALPGKRFSGHVARVAPVVDANTGTFRVTAEFDRDQGLLRPGMFTRLRVIYDQRHDALTIPRSALIEEDGQHAVFVVEKKAATPKPPATPKAHPGDAVAAEPAKPTHELVAQRRSVQVGYSDGNRVEIVKGLKPGDRVITLGRNAVRDGSAVQLISDAPAAAASSGDAR
jgi:membrane fusion protein, multidrug efflux system